MVLSNKKLKQKLRQKLAESLASSAVVAVPNCTNAPNGDPNLQTQSLKDLLDSVAQKPRLSKREKRRKTLPLKGLNSSKAQEEVADKEDSKVNEESKEVSLVGTDVNDVEADGKKKKKKRKRDAVAKEASVADGGEDGVVKEAKESKKKNKKKKKKGNKNKKQKTKTKSPEEKVGEQEQGVTETNDNMDSQVEVVVPNKIYVGGIPFYYNEDDIRNYFRTCGKITEVDCKMRPEDGEFSGIAFITFETEDSATRALAFDRAAMGERFLTIQPYKKAEVKKVSDFAPEMVKGYNRIYCGNLAWDITENDLRDFFSDCNTAFIRLGTDKETKEFKGYAHVGFKDSVSMAMALKLDQGIVCGRTIRISCAVSNKGGHTNYKSASTSKRDGNGSSKSVLTTETDDDISRANNGTSKSVPTTETDKDISKSAPPVEEEPYYGGEEAYYGGEEQYYGGEEQYYGGEEAYYGGASNEADNGSSVPADNGGSTKVSGKIRRRTCYECGQKGHLFSDCPKKQAADPTN